MSVRNATRRGVLEDVEREPERPGRLIGKTAGHPRFVAFPERHGTWTERAVEDVPRSCCSIGRNAGTPTVDGRNP